MLWQITIEAYGKVSHIVKEADSSSLAIANCVLCNFFKTVSVKLLDREPIHTFSFINHKKQMTDFYFECSKCGATDAHPKVGCEDKGFFNSVWQCKECGADFDCNSHDVFCFIKPIHTQPTLFN